MYNKIISLPYVPGTFIHDMYIDHALLIRCMLYISFMHAALHRMQLLPCMYIIYNVDAATSSQQKKCSYVRRVRIRVNVYTYIRTCTPSCTHTHHTRYTCKHVHIMYTCVRVLCCMYVCMYTYVCVYTHIHIHVHIDTFDDGPISQNVIINKGYIN